MGRDGEDSAGGCDCASRRQSARHKERERGAIVFRHQHGIDTTYLRLFPAIGCPDFHLFQFGEGGSGLRAGRYPEGGDRPPPCRALRGIEDQGGRVFVIEDERGAQQAKKGVYPPPLHDPRARKQRKPELAI